MLVSIIIPVYNQEVLLKRAIESIPLSQDLEVIIIDDGSTDNTYYVAKELSKINNIKIIHLDNNGGVANARNIGIDNALGEYIFMLDSDDYLYTDNFIKALQYLTGTDLVYYNYTDNKHNTTRVNDKNKIARCGQVKFIRKEFINDLRYESGRRVAEDWFFNLKLQEKKPTETFTDLIVFHYNYPRVGSLSYQRKQYRKTHR